MENQILHPGSDQEEKVELIYGVLIGRYDRDPAVNQTEADRIPMEVF